VPDARRPAAVDFGVEDRCPRDLPPRCRGAEIAIPIQWREWAFSKGVKLRNGTKRNTLCESAVLFRLISPRLSSLSHQFGCLWVQTVGCFIPAQLPQLFALGPSLGSVRVWRQFLAHREISQSRPRTEKPVRHDMPRHDHRIRTKNRPRATHYKCNLNSALPPPS
jgi:hypothetical protein